MRARMIIDEQSKPTLRRHVKLRRDEVRDRWVLLAPERMLIPDAVALAILQQLDGQTTVQGLIEQLSEAYEAPRDVIRKGTLVLLQDLADKDFLEA